MSRVLYSTRKTVITLYTITDDLIYPVGGQDTNYTWGHVSTTALSFDWAWNLVAKAVELKLWNQNVHPHFVRTLLAITLGLHTHTKLFLSSSPRAILRGCGPSMLVLGQPALNLWCSTMRSSFFTRKFSFRTTSEQCSIWFWAFCKFSQFSNYELTAGNRTYV